MTYEDRSARGGRVLLVRHGETAWSRSGRHTGRTDVPLDPSGEAQAVAVGEAARQAGWEFDLVLTSPLRRAVDTCSLAGLAGAAQVRADLAEWDYGAYEGMTSAEIAKGAPGWSLWRDGAPEGETPEQVGARADRVLTEIAEAQGCVGLFAHGHVLRVLAARWLGLDARAGGLFGLDAGHVSILGHEHAERVIWLWNAKTPGPNG